ncbi:MAG: Crp/Fnr family transcriptional regulator [Pseudomonadota bacterium]
MDTIARDFNRTVSQMVAPLIPDPDVLRRLLARSSPQRVSKGEVILLRGDVPGHVYFVADGLMRMVSTDAETGTERTAQFFDAGQMFTDPVAFFTQTPSTHGIEAIEPSHILAMPRDALFEAFDEDHAVERVGRIFIQETLIGTHKRASRLLTLTVEERYETFLRTRPEVARRLPQYLIASYLGVTPEGLSRIRRRIAHGAQAHG